MSAQLGGNKPTTPSNPTTPAGPTPSVDPFSQLGYNPFTTGAKPAPVQSGGTATNPFNYGGSGGWGAPMGYNPFTQPAPTTNTSPLGTGLNDILARLLGSYHGA